MNTRTDTTDTTATTATTDTTFNGWANWTTWNLSLWIQNDESLYYAARRCASWADLVRTFADCGCHETPDGARFDSPEANVAQLESMLAELD